MEWLEGLELGKQNWFLLLTFVIALLALIFSFIALTRKTFEHFGRDRKIDRLSNLVQELLAQVSDQSGRISIGQIGLSKDIETFGNRLMELQGELSALAVRVRLDEAQRRAKEGDTDESV